MTYKASWAAAHQAQTLLRMVPLLRSPPAPRRFPYARKARSRIALTALDGDLPVLRTRETGLVGRLREPVRPPLLLDSTLRLLLRISSYYDCLLCLYPGYDVIYTGYKVTKWLGNTKLATS